MLFEEIIPGSGIFKVKEKRNGIWEVLGYISESDGSWYIYDEQANTNRGYRPFSTKHEAAKFLKS